MRKFPVYACPAVRGAPISILNGVPMSNGAPFNNRFIGDMLQGMPQFIGILSVGNPTDPECAAISALALRECDVATPFMFWVTDLLTTGTFSFSQRLEILKPMVAACSKQIQYVGWKKCADEAALKEYHAQILIAGHPGITTKEDDAKRELLQLRRT